MNSVGAINVLWGVRRNNTADNGLGDYMDHKNTGIDNTSTLTNDTIQSSISTVLNPRW